eukprot:CFRG2321T1
MTGTTASPSVEASESEPTSRTGFSFDFKGNENLKLNGTTVNEKKGITSATTSQLESAREGTVNDNNKHEKSVLQNGIVDREELLNKSAAIIEAWCADSEKCQKHLEQFRLMKVLGRRPRRGVGGKVIIRSVLPNKIANAAYRCIEGITEEEWDTSSEATDRNIDGDGVKSKSTSTAYGAGSTLHRYDATSLSGNTALKTLQNTMAKHLYPECKLFSFQLGRYRDKDQIESHDDAAYEDFDISDETLNKSTPTQCSRDIAVIYYLAKNWKEDMGGVLVDHTTNERHVPLFNSLVAFHVPRLHEVTAVTEHATMPRYSIFGWFYAPGKLYQIKSGPKNAKKNKKRKLAKKAKSGVMPKKQKL